MKPPLSNTPLGATARDRAVQTLQHYIRLAVEHGPRYVELSGDCYGEIESLVDDIITAAVERLRQPLAEAVELLERQANRLMVLDPLYSHTGPGQPADFSAKNKENA